LPYPAQFEVKVWEVGYPVGMTRCCVVRAAAERRNQM